MHGLTFDQGLQQTLKQSRDYNNQDEFNDHPTAGQHAHANLENLSRDLRALLRIIHSAMRKKKNKLVKLLNIQPLEAWIENENFGIQFKINNFLN